MPEPTANILLESSLETAVLGDREAIASFYLALLNGPLYSIKRQQAQPVSNSPKYPSDLFPFLAVQDQAKVVLPIFSRPQKIFEWSSQEFAWQETSAKQLFQLIPADWYICVNPGSDVEKELTPWEIQELNSGPESIAGLVEEIASAEDLSDASVSLVSENEYQELKQALKECAKGHPELLSMQLMRETQATQEPQDSTLILNICLANGSSEKSKQIQNELSAISKKYLIGAENIKVLAFEKRKASSEIENLGQSSSFYEADSGLFKALFSKFSSVLKRP